MRYEHCEFNEVSLFTKPISDLFKSNTEDAINELNQIPEKQLFSINEEEYLKKLVSDYLIDYPSVNFESVTQNSKYSEYGNTIEDKNILCVMFYVEYDGWFNNFQYRASDFNGFNEPVNLLKKNSYPKKEVVFEIIDTEYNPESVKEKYIAIKSTFEENYPKILKEIEGYNSKLEETLTPVLKEKIERVNRIKNMDDVLGIPKRK
ncbi:hypothetical protein HNP89_000606 [Methanococcus maripaludis]|uniref:Uncharacterized protein n=1 Tax=Methanococcus maripaludis TaxID=39152 RepID=A0A7J9NY82_METMI|nr:hypothetical protein [Methanococcus maripaludis]MBA2852669.1 hypothetical protein [Methanococcus maripaludis]